MKNRSATDRTVRDHGSVLVISVVLVAVASAGVTGLAAHTGAVERSSSAARLAFVLDASVRSAVRLVAADTGSTCPGATRTVALNGHAVTVSCTTTTDASTDTPRRGVITTTNSATTSSFTPPAWAGSTAAAIAGDIVINTGTSTAPSSALLDDTTPGWQTRSVAWTGHVTIPPLPLLPAQERPGPLVTRSGCSIYYPGRYPGSVPLALTGGQHYFASGVYYFERPISITSGARLVMGSGDVAGCVTDTQAVTDLEAPTLHGLTGRGVTLIFGAGGRMTVQESSLVINRRAASPDTADTHDVAIRTVSTGVNSTVIIPADQQRRTDGTLGAVSGYLTSTVNPTLGWVVDVRLNGTTVTSNRVLIDGAVHAPISGVRFTSTVSSYALRFGRGLVASRVSFALSSTPSDATNYQVGFVARPGRSRSVLLGTVAAHGRSAMAEQVIS